MTSLLLASVIPENDLPSIFELTFLKQMDQLSVNAIDHVSQNVLNRYDTTRNTNTNFSTLLKHLPWNKWLVDILSLHFADGLVSEAMYGLKRVCLTEGNEIESLTPTQKVIVFLTEVLGPHLLDLGASLHCPDNEESASAATNTNTASSSSSSSSSSSTSSLSNRSTSISYYCKRILKRISKWVKIIWGILVVWRKLLYVYGSSPYLTPVCDRFQIALLKRSKAVYGSILNNPQSKEGPSTGSSSTGGRLRYLSMMIFAMSVKFLEWQMRQRREQGNNNDTLANTNTTSSTSSSSSINLLNKLKILRDASTDKNTSNFIPPPRRPPVGVGCISPPKSPNLCPLCLSSRVTPCASSGGYVYCYLCLIRHLRAHTFSELLTRQKELMIIDDSTGVNDKSTMQQLLIDSTISYCPVTGIPCREEDVIRIYEAK